MDSEKTAKKSCFCARKQKFHPTRTWRLFRVIVFA